MVVKKTLFCVIVSFKWCLLILPEYRLTVNRLLIFYGLKYVIHLISTIGKYYLAILFSFAIMHIRNDIRSVSYVQRTAVWHDIQWFYLHSSPDTLQIAYVYMYKCLEKDMGFNISYLTTSKCSNDQVMCNEGFLTISTSATNVKCCSIKPLVPWAQNAARFSHFRPPVTPGSGGTAYRVMCHLRGTFVDSLDAFSFNLILFFNPEKRHATYKYKTFIH